MAIDFHRKGRKERESFENFPDGVPANFEEADKEDQKDQSPHEPEFDRPKEFVGIAERHMPS